MDEENEVTILDVDMTITAGDIPEDIEPYSVKLDAAIRALNDTTAVLNELIMVLGGKR